MPRQSWRKKVRIIKPNGKIVRDTREFGEYLLESGLAEAVPEEKRFTVRLIDTSNYKEELRHASGRRVVNTKSKSVRKNLAVVTASDTHRFRPPRQKLSEEEEEFQEYKRDYTKRCA